MIQNHSHVPHFKRSWTLVVLGLLCTVVPQAQGQDTASRKPATAEDARKVIDLATFPLMEGAEAPGSRLLANLTYQAKANVKTAYEFQKKALAAKGWKEQPNAYIADDSASGTFGKDGFVASVSILPGDATKGTVSVMIIQHGNVDVAKLPIPPGAKLLYGGPVSSIFQTDASRDDTATACRKLLLAQGWQPYGTAGDSQIFKQNVVRLNAMISSAPAQDGKTMIQYSTELLSVDLPAPPDPVRAHYADTIKGLEFDVKSTPQALVDYYRATLAKAGWKPTTDASIKTGDHEMLIFRNAEHDMLTLQFSPIDDVLRGTLRHQSAAEVAELERLAKEKAAAAKKKTADRPDPTPEPTVKIALPADAGDVKQEEDGDLKFTVKAGTGKAAAEALRATLKKDGWKEDTASLSKSAGVVILSKEDSGTLTIHYTDAFGKSAEVSITAFRVVIEPVKPAADSAGKK